MSELHNVQIPASSDKGGIMKLGTFDKSHGGRSVPLLYFYPTPLSPTALLTSLSQTLIHYPFYSGRYTPPDQSNPVPFPQSIELSNAGVPVEVVESLLTMAEATSYLSSVHSKTAHEPYAPSKPPMDPDKVSPEAPILSVKITTFKEGTGTCLSILFQHFVSDANGAMTFMTHWSQIHSSLPPLPTPPPPLQDRDMISLNPPPPLPSTLTNLLSSFPLSNPPVPGFMSDAPKFFGASTTCYPIPSTRCALAKKKAAQNLKEGQFVSTDDVILAHVWKAMCFVRCKQLEVDESDPRPTIIHRALNLRARSHPPPPPAFPGNLVSNVSTSLPINELLSMSATEVALKLRLSVSEMTPDIISAVQNLHASLQSEGKKPFCVFPSAFAFLNSSWRCGWEDAVFDGAKPTLFDQGCHVPIVSVFTNRPEKDGVNVYFTGTEAACKHFNELLSASL
ncbi:hypothetical protein TrCOL_g10517 [Triparma columacea]|uniref:Transferase n=1 Tax=Triparma columacea TaxID=722753 RepID=A0A9W7GR80_9STRA|nr:hypothetical protein TrCOL_g10517 [Triparma columacea]